MTNGKSRVFTRLRIAAKLLVLTALTCILLLVADELSYADSESMDRHEFINLGSLAALLVCPLVAFRTGWLQDYFWAPCVAFLAGYLDLHVVLWLFGSADWPLAFAAIVPTWGVVIGLWVARSQCTTPRRIATFAIIVLADLGARADWMFDLGRAFDRRLLSDWSWLAEPMVYAPPAVLAVLLARRDLRTCRNRTDATQVQDPAVPGRSAQGLS
ncbi:MAG TPA: hypothetical protein VMV10_29915 [Pirellulales bacterium]|nr:hypothetical protein [Pirellulales bacterium]